MQVCYDYSPEHDDPAWTLTTHDVLYGANTTFPPNFAWGTATAAYQVEGEEEAEK